MLIIFCTKLSSVVAKLTNCQTDTPPHRTSDDIILKGLVTGFEPDLCGIPDVMEDHQVKVVPVGLIDHVRAETIQIALSLFLSVQISLICV